MSIILELNCYMGCFCVQAFLEMETEDSAYGMIKYHSTPPNCALVRGKQVFIQFSKHKQLVVDQINSPQVHFSTNSMMTSIPACIL